jgi:hypothetical protein
MEQFFTKAFRFQHIWEDILHDDEAVFAEVELAVKVEEFLNHPWSWEDLRAFLTGCPTPKILWITDDMFLMVGDAHDLFLDYESPYVSFLVANFTYKQWSSSEADVYEIQ